LSRDELSGTPEVGGDRSGFVPDETAPRRAAVSQHLVRGPIMSRRVNSRVADNCDSGSSLFSLLGLARGKAFAVLSGGDADRRNEVGAAWFSGGTEAAAGSSRFATTVFVGSPPIGGARFGADSFDYWPGRLPTSSVKHPGERAGAHRPARRARSFDGCFAGQPGADFDRFLQPERIGALIGPAAYHNRRRRNCVCPPGRRKL